MAIRKKRFIIIDSNSIIHRAFHALPPLTTKKGELVNAIYGFLLVFLKVIREFQPDYIAACFDYPAPTFRHKKYKEYKITRPPAPEELYQQIPKVKEILKIFNVPIFEKESFEADDLIGTVSRLAPTPEIETIIVSGDLDTLQLVDSKTKVYALKRGVKDIVLYDEKLVKEKFQGLVPEQLLDFKALKGDPSDNIPGIPGIGEKTAIQLIKQFGSLENLYSALISGKKISALNQQLGAKLEEYKKQAFLNKELVEIKKNVPLDFSLKECQWGKYEEEKVVKVLKSFGFESLIKRLSEIKQKIFRQNLKLW